MLRLTKKTEYGLIALMHMARDNDQAVHTAREISRMYSISLDILSKVLQNLARSRIIESIQGVKGGYVLAGELGTINVANVIKSIEGPVSLVECVEVDCSCDRLDNCNIQEPMRTINGVLKGYFDALTLEELVAREQDTSTPVELHL